MTEPRIVERAAQPYVGITASVPMDGIPAIADRLPYIFGWLAARDVTPVGAPFLKYNVVAMDAELEIEAGVPVPPGTDGDGEIVAGLLPAGRYATLTHVGHPGELVEATARLLGWAAAQGLEWDTSRAGRWAARLEIYHTDPAVEPDMTRWETELAFRLA